MLNVLLTSGGTKVPIDSVRDITNMSSGTFGSKIGTELLKEGCFVHFLRAEHSKSPMEVKFDLNKGDSDCFDKLMEAKEFFQKHKGRYKEYSYRNYNDYAEVLENTCLELQPDVVILAAAVSDYVTQPINAKIRSSENLVIEFKHAPKLISKVKQWCPTTFLVGFKLMVDVSEVVLWETMKKSLFENNCDLIVGNDLLTLKAGQHRIEVAVNRDGEAIKIDPKIDSDHSARDLVKIIMGLCR